MCVPTTTTSGVALATARRPLAGRYAPRPNNNNNMFSLIYSGVSHGLNGGAHDRGAGAAGGGTDSLDDGGGVVGYPAAYQPALRKLLASEEFTATAKEVEAVSRPLYLFVYGGYWRLGALPRRSPCRVRYNTFTAWISLRRRRLLLLYSLTLKRGLP